jgi:hypothetical protein
MEIELDTSPATAAADDTPGITAFSDDSTVWFSSFFFFAEISRPKICLFYEITVKSQTTKNQNIVMFKHYNPLYQYQSPFSTNLLLLL